MDKQLLNKVNAFKVKSKQISAAQHLNALTLIFDYLRQYDALLSVEGEINAKQNKLYQENIEHIKSVFSRLDSFTLNGLYKEFKQKNCLEDKERFLHAARNLNINPNFVFFALEKLRQNQALIATAKKEFIKASEKMPEKALGVDYLDAAYQGQLIESPLGYIKRGDYLIEKISPICQSKTYRQEYYNKLKDYGVYIQDNYMLQHLVSQVWDRATQETDKVRLIELLITFIKTYENTSKELVKQHFIRSVITFEGSRAVTKLNKEDNIYTYPFVSSATANDVKDKKEEEINWSKNKVINDKSPYFNTLTKFNFLYLLGKAFNDIILLTSNTIVIPEYQSIHKVKEIIESHIEHIQKEIRKNNVDLIQSLNEMRMYQFFSLPQLEQGNFPQFTTISSFWQDIIGVKSNYNAIVETIRKAMPSLTLNQFKTELTKFSVKTSNQNSTQNNSVPLYIIQCLSDHVSFMSAERLKQIKFLSGLNSLSHFKAKETIVSILNGYDAFIENQQLIKSWLMEYNNYAKMIGKSSISRQEVQEMVVKFIHPSSFSIQQRIQKENSIGIRGVINDKNKGAEGFWMSDKAREEIKHHPSNLAKACRKSQILQEKNHWVMNGNAAILLWLAMTPDEKEDAEFVNAKGDKFNPDVVSHYLQ